MDFRAYLEKLRSLTDNQKKIVLWTIVIVLAVIMGFFWFKTTINRFSNLEGSFGNIQFPEIELPEMQTQGNETENWKIYKNEEYGFEFMYPDDWHWISANPNDVMTFLEFCVNTDNICSSGTVRAVVYKLEIGKKMLQSAREQGPGYIEENININENPAVKRQKSYCNGAPMITNVVFIEKDSLMYQIEGPTFSCETEKDIVNKNYRDLEGVFNQILSTFKFTN